MGRALIIIGLAVLVSFANAIAQENVRFQLLSTNDGMSQVNVYSICQDQFGFLWIGTQDGLNRYDGHSFEKFTRNQIDSSSLYFNQINDIQLESSGNLWIGGTGGISIYNYPENNFDNFVINNPELKGAQVNEVYILGNSSALLSTDKGLVTFDRTNSRFYIEEKFRFFSDKRVKNFRNINDEIVYVGTDDGLFSKKKNENSWSKQFEGNKIHDIYFDGDKIYICTSSGLYKWSNAKQEFVAITLPGNVAEVEGCYRVKNGDLWVAAGRVVILDADDVVKSVLEHDQFVPHSLSYNSAKIIYQTNDGVIWVGTGGLGLNKFNPDVLNFSYLSVHTSPSLSNDYVSSIFTADDTTLLVGTIQGLDVIDLKKKSRVSFYDCGNVFRIDVDGDGSIWVGSDNGFFQYISNKLVLRNGDLKKANNFAEWNSDQMIVCTEQSGIYLLDKRTHRPTIFIPPSELPKERPWVKVEKDVVWLGAKDGLRLYDKNGKLLRHFQTSTNPRDLASSWIKYIYRDNDGELWICTGGGGLSKFNISDSTFTNYTTNDGLPNNVVYGILEDEMGTFWLSTNMGLSAFSVRDKQFRNFDLTHGLQGNEFNTNAYFKSVNGWFYFGGINGLSFFKPAEVKKLPPSPSVLITRILVNNKAYSFQASDSVKNPMLIRKISTDLFENDIGIEFTTINFKHPEKNIFQYSLADSGWFNIEKRRNIELVNLSSGEHALRLRARNSAGHWGDSYGPLVIYVRPYYWERAWFRILAVVAFIMIVVGIYRYRAKRLVELNAKLNRVVQERTKEIKRKNDKIEAQNEEIMTQYEQLKKQTFLVEEKNLILNNQREQLLRLSQDLERKVEERTRDIQELNNDLMDQNIQLEQFSFIIAHNIRGPVARLKGLLNILPAEIHNNSSNPEIFQYMKSAMEDMDTVIVDVNRILSIKKYSREFFEIVDLLETLDKTVSLMTNDISAKDAVVDVEAFERLKIRGSKEYVQSIFFNLIQNSLKFARNDVRCEIKITSCVVNDKVRIEVVDNGIGIDIQLAWSKIFRLYQRFTYGGSGKGFGLFLVKTQVEQMDGEISVESTLGEGSKFIIVFPIMNENS